MNTLRAARAGKVSMTVGEITQKNPNPPVTVVIESGDFPGVELPIDDPVDLRGPDYFYVQIFSETALSITIRISDVDSKNDATRYTAEIHLKPGRKLIQISMTDIAQRIDLSQIRQILMYFYKAPSGSVVRFERIGFGAFQTEPTLTAEEWALHPDPTIPNPFIDPDPDMVLWHTYNDKLGHEDVADFSRHGDIGEFNNADRIPTDKLETGNLGIRLYGEYRKGTSLGYRIMPSDALDLKAGTVSFWMMIDGSRPVKKGIILAAGKSGNRKNIAVSFGRKGVSLNVSFGRKIATPPTIPTHTWVHVVWTFDETSQHLFIDGKPVAEVKSGASLNGAGGLFVGHDGSKWSRTHSGSNGFAGTLDDLRIYNKKMTVFRGLKSRPSNIPPKFGIVLHYDFSGDEAINRAGSDLRGTDVNITEKNVAGWTKWKKDDTAWVFTENRKTGGSSVTIPKSPILDLPDGTMELRFRIDRYQPDTYWPSWFVLNVYDQEPGVKVFPRFMLKLDCHSGKGDYVPRNAKGMTMILDHSWHTENWNSDLVKPDITLKTGEWIKLVVVWHATKNTNENYTDLWINDAFLGRYNNTSYCLLGNLGPVRLGSYAHKVDFQLGADMTVTDLVILNYRRSVYISDK